MKKAPAVSEPELTPRGRLEEGGMHGLLGYHLAQATIVTDGRFMRAAGQPMNLRPVEFTILQLVRENAEVTPTRLARALAITTPGITAWLDKLEARKLLVRERSAADGRAQHLRLTAEGKAKVNKALQALLEAEAQLGEQLSPGERVILLELLRKVAQARPARD
ncbi:MAG TPA: MarR family winged helix-turn-helix transcriptional regulator [Ramlibacter sp.]|nr:MarR family winged helix-turn-helix transcriptional regulator [Ramlibacter sp.]